VKKHVAGSIFLVSILFGAMIGLEFHIDRSSPASVYTSYLAASNSLTTAMNNSAKLNKLLTSVRNEYQTLYRATQLHNNGLNDLKKELIILQKQAGLTPSVGEGISITINYDPNLPMIPGLTFVDEAVQLQMVINDLQSVGATAIAINNERLITTSSIRSVNGLTTRSGPFSGVVQVNGEPIAAPYVIDVIGSIPPIMNLIAAEGLKDQFSILDQLFQVKVYHAPSLLHIPAYTGVLPGQYSTEVGM
jgi:uncharacterized protein YlxW (UPF0749 family)